MRQTQSQPLLNTIADPAAQVCGASDALIYRIDGNVLGFGGSLRATRMG